MLTLGSPPGHPPPHCLEQSQDRDEGLGWLACSSDWGTGRSGLGSQLGLALGPGLPRDQRPAGPRAGKEPCTPLWKKIGHPTKLGNSHCRYILPQLKLCLSPWLVWLSGLSASLQIFKGSPV